MTTEELIELINKKNWYLGLSQATSGIKFEINKKLVELTSFLFPSATPLQRAWHVINNVYEIPKCKFCMIENVNWSKSQGHYSEYCSPKCVANSHITKDKIKKTNIEKYGVECSLLNKTILEKRSDTNLKKYGTKTPSLNKDIISKIKESSKKTYKNNDIISKRISTNRERYGVDHFPQHHVNNENLILLNSKEWLVDQFFQNKKSIADIAKELNVSKDTVSNYFKKFDIKITPSNISIENFNILNSEESLKRMHIDEKLSIQEISDKIGVSKDTIISKFNKLNIDITQTPRLRMNDAYHLEDKEWLMEENHIHEKTLEKISKEINCHPSYISLLFKKYNIEVIKHNDSMQEVELYEFLKSLGIKNIYRNNRDEIGLELDFWLPDHKMAIEINGLFWHSEIFKKSNYHYIKYDLCRQKNIKLIQIFEDEWKQKRYILENKISYMLHLNNNKIAAKKTICKLIDEHDKKAFFVNNHIQSDGPSSINYGLYDGEKLVAAMGFIKNRNNSFILNRYATSKIVMGGFSKLLKTFERDYNIPPIITFADLRWGTGDLYINNGFLKDKLLKPDYYWAKNNNRYHKFNFRHTQMKKKLKNYNPSLSETENMHNNGYYKIYDVGKIRFIKNQ